ncbi:tRNA pseudouridine(38-40) synthase TruA [Hoeflea sp. YIM 152468]|uniref:tRNA pseudouridine(38-40) synthase TruA n=1 Tax=Hoeflea sp. YIM 152468 TaxID=3031759 RepID=UPI0023DC8125|nr:tRNA pseudouridine(38-40) synthase TruA [Hoeflea sp. YIM 152468]MDF1608299.1 tRNA pseudouridine(38-40) synthase TruA [Hoeflea sp. YIM 152468]
MPRYRLDIEYDGTGYSGWQRQTDHPSIQQAIETAIFKFCGETTLVRGAGRTDAGVHALGQVAHVDLEKSWPVDTVRDAVNAHLLGAGERVGILAANLVDDGFDARFSALKRHYIYRIICRRTPLVIEKNRALWSSRMLDVEAMHAAAQSLVGLHDFTTFRSTNCQANSPVRNLDRLDVVAGATEGLIEIHASARSFLHNQIRSFAGTLRLVGAGKWSTADVEAALAARDRKACGPVAAAAGLYFCAVEYPDPAG